MKPVGWVCCLIDVIFIIRQVLWLVMRIIDSTKPILVTGASGYIASWIIEFLLERGYRVRGTVRSKADSNRLEHLKDMASRWKGQLSVYEADLMRHGSFQEAMEGCELVLHTASPFRIQGVQNPQKELVDPALEGTRNVLFSAQESTSVQRVVLTSSVAAIYGDACEIEDQPRNIFTESVWNVSSSLDRQPYSYSKTLAEREAWRIARSQMQWDLVVINPAFVLGPSMSRRTDSTSIEFIQSILRGRFRTGAPALYYGVVDVRDVAQAHIQAGFTPEAAGRNIVCNTTVSILDIANILEKKYGRHFPLPRREVPKWLVQTLAPLLGVSRQFVRDNIGYPLAFDNTRSIHELSINYRPIQETVLDQAAQLIQDGLC